MRKIIAAFNLTADGVYDHTAVDPDAAIHQHYTSLLHDAGIILYGRTTYELMQYWQTFKEKPSEEPSMNRFAAAIDQLPKIVFSSTLKETGWHSAVLANKPLEETVLALKQQPGKDILAGSRSIILQLMQANLVDEYQFCVHPVIAGSGPLMFENIHRKFALTLLHTKVFGSGAVLFYYAPAAQ